MRDLARDMRDLRTKGMMLSNRRRMLGIGVPSSNLGDGALSEHDNQYLDSLGTVQNSNNFSIGRASGGVKLAYPWCCLVRR